MTSNDGDPNGHALPTNRTWHSAASTESKQSGRMTLCAACVIGMNHDQEVQVQTRGPDGGNPTPRRQGRVWREAGRARVVPHPPFFTARAGPKEVVGA